ncbi:NAD(P)/FAD-dependent oxidoreductase [Nocardia sp. CDC159]|uniref:NAD(P)/FAD-dependent oxidoreductase n=1 Tax=Nocardia pulmonis TaxID=2951408 RepID=A0A9X2EB21_9NOCA|nr:MULTISPECIES: NAD(P)/FAD-dependent oxidoreductase [Nocardia]MCM6777629.1 NAD(P)/FAD-dependent oxidoreductase [Nocardia pulmonis]MCM6790567.1 NAD(P)/FAD-dependent oxidoreductase [Nocardia sp. CDC159]
MNETTYDVVIVGGGAAGLSAALVLGRARRWVAVVDAGQPRNAPAEHMHGYLSRDGMPPAELLATGRREIADYGVELFDDRVVAAESAGCGLAFTIRLASGKLLRARRVLVATGLRDELPELPGVRERWGRDVLHCPYCHGYEVSDQPIALIGGDEPGAAARAVHLALLLPQWSPDLVFFPHTQQLTEVERRRIRARGVRIVDGKVVRLAVADDALRGVELADGRAVARSVVFVAPTFVPDNAVLTALGCEIGSDGWVVTDSAGRTSVAGVWAAGNVADPRMQVITAAGAACATAIAINADLVAEDSIA